MLRYNTVMSIKGSIQKIKGLVRREDLLIISLIVLVAFAGFGLGRLSKIREYKTPVRVEQPAAETQAGASGFAAGQESGTLVASKNSDKYHYPWCSGARRIKEENRIWFEDAAGARAAGYEPAGNCKGLE